MKRCVRMVVVILFIRWTFSEKTSCVKGTACCFLTVVSRPVMDCLFYFLDVCNLLVRLWVSAKTLVGLCS